MARKNIRTKIGVAAVIGIVAAAHAVPAQARGAGEKRYERVERVTYDMPKSSFTLGLAGSGGAGIMGGCLQEPLPSDCITVPVTRADKFVAIVIKDDSGARANAFVTQGPRYGYEVCGQAAGQRVIPSFDLQIEVTQGGCYDTPPAILTGGTVTLRFSNRL